MRPAATAKGQFRAKIDQTFVAKIYQANKNSTPNITNRETGRFPTKRDAYIRKQTASRGNPQQKNRVESTMVDNRPREIRNLFLWLLEVRYPSNCAAKVS